MSNELFNDVKDSEITVAEANLKFFSDSCDSLDKLHGYFSFYASRESTPEEVKKDFERQVENVREMYAICRSAVQLLLKTLNDGE